MKKSGLKLALYAFATMLFLASCENMGLTNEEIAASTTDETLVSTQLFQNLGITTAYCGTPKTVDFWAGQHIDAGDVVIYNDAQYLYVTVNTTWGFQNTSENLKMWVGTDLLLLPRSNGGAPINGQFPYKVTVAAGVNSYTYQILLADIATYDANSCGQQDIFVVVHGDVLADQGNGTIGGETAYGGDISGDGNRWWFYTNYKPSCCESTPPPTSGTMETAFVKFSKTGAYGTGYVFTTNKRSNPEKYESLKLTQNRWGWAGNVVTDGTTTFDVYAGCGLNNVANGTKVGTAIVSKSGSTVTVTYNMLSGFSMEELHVYAGDMKPLTLAPGQYGYIQYFGETSANYATSHTATFEVADTNGDGVWIIAHAVAFGNF
jgi:hypothetical protein